jgi:hypothetical protein
MKTYIKNLKRVQLGFVVIIIMLMCAILWVGFSFYASNPVEILYFSSTLMIFGVTGSLATTSECLPGTGRCC